MGHRSQEWKALKRRAANTNGVLLGALFSWLSSTYHYQMLCYSIFCRNSSLTPKYSKNIYSCVFLWLHAVAITALLITICNCLGSTAVSLASVLRYKVAISGRKRCYLTYLHPQCRAEYLVHSRLLKDFVRSLVSRCRKWELKKKIVVQIE